jgi:1-acyl-sn-glycerol-3-phosphate acyltransferase
MIYSALRFLMYFALRVFFRRVYFSNIQELPKDEALILACNHPNSFLDAIILATLLPRPLHFLARSDVFDKAWKRWLLNKIHLIPIYRLEEGVENLSKNENTFRICIDILKKKGVILIFSEGICVQEKRLRPLKKGTAKLAFRAESEAGFQLGLQVMAVGINYTYPAQVRSEVMISMAKAIRLAQWKEKYQNSPSRAIVEFNQVIRKKLLDNIITIDNKKLEDCTERLLIIRRNDHSTEDKLWQIDSKARLTLEKECCMNIEELARLHPEQFQQIDDLSKSYFDTLSCHRLEDKYFAKKSLNSSHSQALGLKYAPVFNHHFLAFFGYLIYLLAYGLNGAPLLLAQYITHQKVKRIEFYASVLLGLSFILGLIYYLVLFIFSIWIGGWWGLGFVVILWILGFFAVKFNEAWADSQSYRRFRKFKFKYSPKYQELVEVRQKITQILNSKS